MFADEHLDARHSASIRVCTLYSCSFIFGILEWLIQQPPETATRFAAQVKQFKNTLIGTGLWDTKCNQADWLLQRMCADVRNLGCCTAWGSSHCCCLSMDPHRDILDELPRLLR